MRVASLFCGFRRDHLALLAVAVGLLACSSSSGTSAGRDGGVAERDGGVAADGGGVPDAGVVSARCTQDGQCDGGVCNRCTMTCTARTSTCQQDINCNVLEAFCDSCTNQCQNVRGLCGTCTEDRECGLDNKCVTFDGGARACARDCIVSGCPAGYVCANEAGGVKQCRPCAGACNAPGACSRDSDCPYRSFCSVPAGQCPSCATGCADDFACSNGTKCHDNGRCSPACPQTPCPQGYTCSLDGHCKLPGGCTSNAECRDQANPPHYCDLSRNRCIPGCDADHDCLPGANTQGSLCDRAAHRCVPRPCTGTFACAFQQFCNTQAGQCFDANGTYCATCMNDNECNCGTGATCPPGPNKCLEFTDADGGSRGKFCIQGGCMRFDAGIGGESGCPQGYACTEIPTGENTKMNGCFRQCFTPGRR